MPFCKKIVKKHRKEVIMQEDRAGYQVAKIPTAYEKLHKVGLFP
jgi:hypothetical protein